MGKNDDLKLKKKSDFAKTLESVHLDLVKAFGGQIDRPAKERQRRAPEPQLPGQKQAASPQARRQTNPIAESPKLDRPKDTEAVSVEATTKRPNQEPTKPQRPSLA